MMDQSALAFHAPLRFSEKLRVLTARAMSAWLFCAVGPLTMGASAPLSAMSLWAHSGSTAAIVFMLLLTGVVSALSTVICPTRLFGFGCLAAAVGWASMNWSGATMEALLIEVGDAGRAGRATLYGKMAGESVVWGLLAYEALVVEVLVRRWLGRTDLPVAARAERVESTGQRTRRIATAFGITAAVGILIISQIITGSPVAPILKGQVYFAIGLGFYVSTLAALYFAPGTFPGVFCAAVCFTAVASYLWAMAGPDFAGKGYSEYRSLVGLAPFALARPLPVEFLSMGMIGSLLAHGSARKVYASESAEGGQ